MSVFASIAPVENGWSDSRLLLEELSTLSPKEGLSFPEGYLSLFLLVMLLVLIFFFRRTIVGVTGSFLMARDHYRTRVLIDDQYFSDSSVVALLLLLPFFVYSFYFTGVTSLEYWHVLLLLSAYIVLRHIIIIVISWISGHSQMSELRRCFNGFTVLLMSISVLIIPMKVLVPSMNPEVASVYLVCVCVLVNLLYFARSYKIIIASGFSHFFWFLYLCGLEILPIVVVIKVLFS